MHQTLMECEYFTDLNHYKSSMETDIIKSLSSITVPFHQTGHQKLRGQKVLCKFLYAIFQLLIPETENDGAKKGGKDCIHGGHQSFIVHRMGAFEFEIDDGGKTTVHASRR